MTCKQALRDAAAPETCEGVPKALTIAREEPTALTLQGDKLLNPWACPLFRGEGGVISSPFFSAVKAGKPNKLP